LTLRTAKGETQNNATGAEADKSDDTDYEESWRVIALVQLTARGEKNETNGDGNQRFHPASAKLIMDGHARSPSNEKEISHGRVSWQTC